MCSSKGPERKSMNMIQKENNSKVSNIFAIQKAPCLNAKCRALNDSKNIKCSTCG